MKPDAKHPELNMPEQSDTNAALDLFFAPARAPQAVSADLLARIMQDASAVSGMQLAPVLSAPPPRRGVFGSLVDALGGWAAVGGMATATIAGIWLGFTSPALLDQAGLTANAYTISDLMPSVELAMADLDWNE